MLKDALGSAFSPLHMNGGGSWGLIALLKGTSAVNK